MPIIRNLRKDFEEGRMDSLRSITYEESGTQTPFVSKDIIDPPQERGVVLQANKRIDDLTRVSKLLINQPGLQFQANEALLKQFDLTKKLEGNNKKQVGNVIRRTGGTLKHVAQVVASTLLQVPVNGTGTHFVRGFRSDTYIQDTVTRSGFAETFGAGGVEGTQYSLRGERVPMLGLINDSEVPKSNTTAIPGDIGVTNIAIKGKYSPDKPAAPLYNSGSTYYNKTFITGPNSKGIIFPLSSSNFQQSTVVPGALGLDKTATGAEQISPTGGKPLKVNENPALITNTYNPNANKEFYQKTETNIISANNGSPISRGEFITNPASLEDLVFTPYAPFTTVRSGSFGINNKIGFTNEVSGSVAGLAPAKIEIFSSGSRKTKLTTGENIIAVSSTGVIPLDKAGIETTNTIILSQTNNFDSGDVVNLLTDKEPNTPFVTNKFSDSIPYIGRFQTNRTSTLDNINKVQKQDLVVGTDGVLPLRDFSNDPLGLRSISLSDDLITSASYGGLNSSFGEDKPLGTLEDFRSKGQIEGIPESTTDFTGETQRPVKTYAFDYNNININKETRVGLGNPGKVSRNRISYFEQDEDTRDKINMIPVKKEPLDGIAENRDLIQLEFQVITPDDTYYLAFRAFLDTFDDSFNGNWSGNQYLGRADNFYTYTGFERSINLGFKIAAQTREEMEPLYRKAATLASVTAPTYGEKGRFMRGTLSKITVGDYIFEQPGIIESVQYTWQKDYPWEISFQNPEIGDKKGDQILPHVLDVTISFKAIHDFLPVAGITPFITNYRPKKENKRKYIELVDQTITSTENSE